MTTHIEVSDSLVKLSKLISELESLFRNAHPSKDERDRIVILAVELQKHTNIIASWALKA